MQIRIDKQSDVPVRDQLRQQIIFLIGIGQLALGAEMPSVRDLARRLKIHHNTVSHVYSQLAADGWLVQHRGARLTIGRPALESDSDTDLDALIARVVRLARKRGRSLQDLTALLRQRLLTEPADHLLLVVPELQLGELMALEVRQVAGTGCDICLLSALQQNPSLAIGAAVLAPSYLIEKLELPAHATVVALTYSPADAQLAAARQLSHPSVIGVISISDFFLRTANGLLGSALGRRHSFHQLLMRRSGVHRSVSREGIAISRILSRSEEGEAAQVDNLVSADLRGFDLLFCDSVCYRSVTHSNKVPYCLISEPSLAQVRTLAASMQAAAKAAVAH